MTSYKDIGLGNLLLDVANYRIVRQENQKAACDAIVADQGRKLVVLAKDILKLGMNPADVPIVIDAEDGNDNYIVIEGNRRLTAIRLLMEPSMAKEDAMRRAFAKLAKEAPDAIPKVIHCVVAPDRATAHLWASRKHANGLGGAGTEQWTPMAKARAEADQGKPAPGLDIVNFVLTKKDLEPDLRGLLEGSRFNLSTLDRLIETRELKDAAGLELTDGKLSASAGQEWVRSVLTDVVRVIGNGRHQGAKWTEREIDSAEKRETFVREIVQAHKGRREVKPWSVRGDPIGKGAAAELARRAVVRSTPSTEEQQNLIPRKFKLALPAGKINDIFVELKALNVTTYRHAVSVLFRVFLEITLSEYIERHGIALPTDARGRKVDKLHTRLRLVLDHVKDAKLMSAKDLQPINVAISDPGSLLAPDTLNAYVHSKWMNPEPLQLKTGWANVQLFVERLWSSKPGT